MREKRRGWRLEGTTVYRYCKVNDSRFLENLAVVASPAFQDCVPAIARLLYRRSAVDPETAGETEG